MSVQASATLTNLAFILSGQAILRDAQTLLTDGARTTTLKKYTVMAQVASSKKWVPLTDVAAAATGENVARGIYMGDDVTAAALVAGDVTGALILVGGAGCTVDTQQLVFENSLTLDSVCSDDSAGVDNAAINFRRIEDDLARIGIFAESTIDMDALEN